MDRILLAIRYILGRPISLISLIGVFVGVGSIVVVDSVMNGFLLEQMQIIRGSMADVVVMLDKEQRDQETQIEAILGQVRATEGVADAALQMTWPAIYGSKKFARQSGSRSDMFRSIQVLGVETTAASRFEEFDRRHGFLPRPWQEPGLTDGAAKADPFWFDPDHPFWQARVDPEQLYYPMRPIVFGARLASQMFIEVGDVLSLATFGEHEDGSFPKRKKLFVMTGTFQSNDAAFDFTHAFVRLEDLRDFVGVPELAHKINTYVDGQQSEQLVRDRLRSRLDSIVQPEKILTWSDQKRLLLGAIENERSIMNFVLFFLVLIAAFNLFVTLSMMVSEKTREVGVLVSMGSNPGRVASVFLLWGLLVTLVGSSAGLFGGLLLTWNINPVHDAFSSLTGLHLFNPAYYSFSEIPTQVDSGRITMFLVATFLCTGVFTVFPSLSAARLEVVEALRRE